MSHEDLPHAEFATDPRGALGFDEGDRRSGANRLPSESVARVSFDQLRFMPPRLPSVMSEEERVSRVAELRTSIIALSAELRALWQAGLPIEGSMAVLSASLTLRSADCHLVDALHEFPSVTPTWPARAGVLEG